MNSVEGEIQAMVDRETEAWNRMDAEALVSICHPDMVWPWPPDPHAHDPAEWKLIMHTGLLDYGRVSLGG